LATSRRLRGQIDAGIDVGLVLGFGEPRGLGVGAFSDSV